MKDHKGYGTRMRVFLVASA